MGVRRLTSILLALALGIAACTSDDADGAGPLVDASEAVGDGAERYLDDVRRIEDGRADTVQAVVDALNQAYRTRERMFDVFQTVLEGDAVSSALEEARAL